MPRKLCQGSRKNILNWNSVYRADKIVPEYTPAYRKSRTRCRPLPTLSPSLFPVLLTLHSLLGPTTWPGFASLFGGNSIKWKMMLIVNVICSRGLHKSAKKTENWLLIGTERERDRQRERVGGTQMGLGYFRCPVNRFFISHQTDDISLKVCIIISSNSSNDSCA